MKFRECTNLATSDQNTTLPSESNAMVGSTIIRRSSIEMMRLRSQHSPIVCISVQKVNLMLTKMVFIICLLNSMEHFFLSLSLQAFSDYFKSIRTEVIFLCNLTMFIKNSVNFFIFYYFNDFFRKSLAYLLSGFRTRFFEK